MREKILIVFIKRNRTKYGGYTGTNTDHIFGEIRTVYADQYGPYNGRYTQRIT